MPTGPPKDPPPKAEQGVVKNGLFTVARSPGDSVRRVVPQTPYPGVGSTDRQPIMVPHLNLPRFDEERASLADLDEGSELLQLQ